MELEESMWPDIRQLVIENSSSPERLSSLLGSAEVADLTKDSITLAFPTPLMKAGIDRSFIDLLKDAIYSKTEKDFEIITVVDDKLLEKMEKAASKPEPEGQIFSQPQLQGTQPSLSSSSAPGITKDPSTTIFNTQESLPIYTKRMTFDTFVKGGSNEFAYSAAIAVSENPGKTYNPLFIWGNSGLGKTHLLMAITDYFTNLFTDKKAHYFQAKELTKDLAEATLRNEWNIFDTKYNSPDLILIDDIQFLEGKKESVEKFFQIFNDFTDAEKQVVISADRSPREMDMDERMTSRFSQGIVVDVQPPTYEMKFNIINQFLLREMPNVPIDEEVATYVAEISGSNIREIEGALHKLEGYHSIVGCNITVDVAKEVLLNFFPDKSSRTITIAMVQKEVEKFFDVSHDEMISSKRERRINIPRQISMYLSHELTTESYPSIGKKFGNRDHSTIIHGVTKIQTEIKTNRELYDKIETIRQNIKDKA